MSKKINELTAANSTQADEDTSVWPLADAITGLALKVTQAQAKIVFGVLAHKHTATGAEGSTLTIGALSGKMILSIMRESGPIFEVASSPNSSEYTWDDTSIGLGAPVGGAGERFLILYRNY